MYLSRVQIVNFRNFEALDVTLDQNVVMVGENRSGKSNFIYALRLVLDASLPDSSRQLKLSDIWDGCELSGAPSVRIDVDLTDFDADPNLVALLTDYRLSANHETARLSYVFRKKGDVQGQATSEADFEFKVYGGGIESKRVHGDVRRRICLDLLHALRDAEADLGAWRFSPLRPLLEDAIAQVPKGALDAVADDVSVATARLGALEPVKDLETTLRDGISALSGPAQDLRATLGFAPTDSLRLFRSIGLQIDDGKRAIGDASLGSANLALLALKLEEFAWRRSKNERNFTIMCVEEPEAHLHPHLQRRVFQKLFGEDAATDRSLVLTTHSPNVASVSPLGSIVLLRATDTHGTHAFSLADLGLQPQEVEDLQRYLDTTRAEVLFSRGVVFVEGDAEAALVPVFADTLKSNLDEAGVSICSVGGVHFRPYVKLALALNIPFAVITDWDPMDGSVPPLGRKRSIDLLSDIQQASEGRELDAIARTALEEDDSALRAKANEVGIFLNDATFELEVAKTEGLVSTLIAVLDACGFGAKRTARLAAWQADPSTVDSEQLMSMISDVGKGRLAGRMAARAADVTPPGYIAGAIAHVVSRD